jgi:tetratricopeptide (TPR) repeat protein
MYARLGRIEEAERANQRALELDPDNLITHTNLALLYWHLGKSQPALHHAQKALEAAAPEKRAPLESFIAQLRQ